MNNTEKTPLIGVICGIIAYILWGVLPIYWKLAANVPSIEILAYRIIWSFVFMVFLVVCLRKSRSVFGEAVAVLRKPKTFLAITAAAVLITVNWFIFIFFCQQWTCYGSQSRLLYQPACEHLASYGFPKRTSESQ